MLRLHGVRADLAELSRECGSVSLPLASIGVFDCDWQQDMEGSARLRNHVAYLSLTPQPRTIRVAAQGCGHRLAEVSGSGIFPAGQQLEARFGGGRQRLLLCRLSPERFDALLERPMRWDPELRQQPGLPLRSPEVRQLMARMAQEILSPGMASRALLEALCQALVIEIVRSHAPAQPDMAAAAPAGRLLAWQMRRLQERLADRRDDPLSLDEAATLCGIGPRHLMRLFKASTGQTLHQWMAAQQMAHARELLACTERPLKTVAAQLGFRHPGSFTAAFTRECGETPSAWRARAWHGRR